MNLLNTGWCNHSSQLGKLQLRTLGKSIASSMMRAHFFWLFGRRECCNKISQLLKHHFIKLGWPIATRYDLSCVLSTSFVRQPLDWRKRSQFPQAKCIQVQQVSIRTTWIYPACKNFTLHRHTHTCICLWFHLALCILQLECLIFFGKRFLHYC